MKVVCK